MRPGEHEVFRTLARLEDVQLIDQELGDRYRPALVVLRVPPDQLPIRLGHRLRDADPSTHRVNSSDPESCELTPAKPAESQNEDDRPPLPRRACQSGDLLMGEERHLRLS